MTVALLVTSNGAGMGHLSRQLSLALSAGPDDRTALFSLSLGLPQVLGMGVPGEYCPSYERDCMPRYFWNRYLRTRLVTLAREIEAEVVVFDGVAPYRGLLSARQHLPEAAFVWMRRAMWIEGRGEAFLRKAPFFDTVIEPGDLGSAEDRGPTVGRTDAAHIPPLSLLESVPRLARSDAAAALGLDPDRPTILVTLGSGRLGDAATPGRVVLERLIDRSDWQIAVTTSAIARSAVPVSDPGRVVEVRGVYPLVRYLAAFDAAVSACGYNAVHEFVSGGVPTLLVPNRATRTDDQVGRARGVGRRGLALVAQEDDPDGLAGALGELLEESTRRRLVAAIEDLGEEERFGGGSAGWGVVAGAASGHRPTLGERGRALWSAADDAVRSSVMAVIGQERTDQVRRLVRRSSPGGLGEPLPVTVVPDLGVEAVAGTTPLLFTGKMTVADAMAGTPIEHVMPGTSEGYLRERRSILRRNYRVVEDRS